MIRNGYEPPVAASVTAVSAVVAPIIPPSIAMIIYASLTNTSVGSLFVAGIIPGILLALSMGVTVAVISVRRGYRAARADWSARDVARRALGASWAFVLPVLIVGGIRFGVFTATEAGAIGATYALFVGLFVYRELRPRRLPRVLIDAAIDTGVIMMIVAAAAPLSWWLTIERLPASFAGWVLDAANPLVFLMAVNLLLLAVGLVMESVTILILLTPLLAPAAAALGIDPVHFGIIVIVNATIGAITPPFGQLVFVVSAITRIPAERIFRQVALFLPGLIVILLVITYFPATFMWVVDVLGPARR
jgi:tripartite ATP-independent transporter DctM subunit